MSESSLEARQAMWKDKIKTYVPVAVQRWRKSNSEDTNCPHVLYRDGYSVLGVICLGATSSSCIRACPVGTYELTTISSCDWVRRGYNMYTSDAIIMTSRIMYTCSYIIISFKVLLPKQALSP